jgi:hypothetical protein
MLVAQAEDNDLLGQWMAHHLAALLTAAEADTTTVEQRRSIVDLILKVWAHRRSFERHPPLDEFTAVLTALDRLGDDRPWRFSRPFDLDIALPDPDADAPPFAQTALELERVAREAIVHLLWLAAEDAKDKNQAWLTVADAVNTTLESDVVSLLRRLHVRSARRYASLAPATNATVLSADCDTVDPDLDETRAEIRSEVGEHGERLRELAGQLVFLADLIDQSESTSNGELDGS